MFNKDIVCGRNNIINQLIFQQISKKEFACDWLYLNVWSWSCWGNYWQSVTLCCSCSIIQLCEFRRKQPVLARNWPPLSHTWQTTPFSLQQQSLRRLMTFLPKLGFIFCLSIMITLIWPQTSSLWKGFPHSPLPMRGNCYFGFVSLLYKATCYFPVWALYANTIHQQVWEEIFFFSAEGCYVCGVCGVSVREQKSLVMGTEPAGEKLLVVHEHLYSWTLCSFINIRLLFVRLNVKRHI